jgi:SpoVK/Ycf46/Vps4 family AAA+-type ATPase
MPKKQRKQLSLDPTKINNFNKFLITLDQNDDFKPIIKTELKPIIKTELKPTKKTDFNTDLKEQIDILLETINANFKKSNYNATCFTGKTKDDINSQNISENPNNYSELYNETQAIQSNKQNIEYREVIDIDVSINNIDDVLSLIKRYQNDPAIKYNINMKALHNIKEPLEELNNMIGMNELKNNVLDQILYFVQGLHKNKTSASCDYMHTVIYGPPGTGKTEIAKIMGKIYSKLGILGGDNLNSREPLFKKVTRSDLIAGYLGQTTLKTRDVIKDALGGVLFIDEAYSLGNSEKRDSFSKECIDTLCEALSDYKDNLMVIIAGYEKELKDCFFDYNQGLDSRFTWRFKTDKYSAEDLYKIFVKKVKENGWEIHENSKINIEWFEKNKDYLRFYGRDIETIFAKTKIAHSKRVFCKPLSEQKKINLEDLNKGLEIQLKNEDISKNKNEEQLKKILHSTIYC